MTRRLSIGLGFIYFMRDDREPVSRPGLGAFIILLLPLLVFLFYFTGGFVTVYGKFAEYVNSLSRVSLGLFFLFILGIFMIVIGFAKRLKGFVRTGGLLVFIALVSGVVLQAAVIQVETGKTISSSIEHIEFPVQVRMSRIIPLETAYAYAISMIQYPTHTIYEQESYAYYNGSMVVYNWIIEPEGFWNSIKRDAIGTVYVDGSAYPPSIFFEKEPLKWSLHRVRFGVVYDTLYRELKLKAPSLRPLLDNNIEVFLDNHTFILIPLVTWEKTLVTSLPVVKAYALVHPSGDIDIIDVGDLYQNNLTSKIFDTYKIPIVPEEVALSWIQYYRWSPGFVNVAFYHKTFEIRNIGTNPQPYLVYDDNGHLYWLFLTEPSGGSYAVKSILYVDAESSTPRILEYIPDKPLIGISKVSTYITKSHPTYDWTQFKLAEPIPLIYHNHLYWKVTIITGDGRGVVNIDLVDAEDGNVYSMEVGKSLTIKDFYRFLDYNLGIISDNETSTKPTTSREQIMEQIKKMREEIQSLEQQLDELERMLNQTLTNSTSS